jgi:hypothetical protein
MIRALLCLSVIALSGCATYSVEPFYDAGIKQIICCRAVVTNSKNIASVNFDAMESGGVYRIHFVETGVNAAAPIAAAAIAASDISAAVTSAAVTAAKFAPK